MTVTECFKELIVYERDEAWIEWRCLYLELK